MDGCGRGHHAFTSLGEALCGIGSPLLTAAKSVLTRIYLWGSQRSRIQTSHQINNP